LGRAAFDAVDDVGIAQLSGVRVSTCAAGAGAASGGARAAGTTGCSGAGGSGVTTAGAAARAGDPACSRAPACSRDRACEPSCSRDPACSGAAGRRATATARVRHAAGSGRRISAHSGAAATSRRGDPPEHQCSKQLAADHSRLSDANVAFHANTDNQYCVHPIVNLRRTITGAPADRKNKRAFADKLPSVNRDRPSISGPSAPLPGGNALKFYASVRLDIRKIGVVKNGEQMVGNRARVKVVKNKVAPPFREAEFDALYGMGVNVPGEIVDHATTAGLFEKSGSFYSWKGERIAQGRDRACAFVAEHPEVAQEVRLTLLEARKAENAALGAAVQAVPAVQAA
jgi:hypothetical protein